MRIKPCWSCDSSSECTPHCFCLKCLQPEDYAAWRQAHPWAYERWLFSQRIEEAWRMRPLYEGVEGIEFDGTVQMKY